MQTTSRSAPVIGALLMLCACAEQATAPTPVDESGGTAPLEIVVPALDGAKVAATAPGTTRVQRTSTSSLPPELEGENVPSEYLTAPGIFAYDLVANLGERLVTAYAWMTYWATGAHIDLTVSTVKDGKPGFSQTSSAEDVELFPGNYSLSTALNVPFTYSCGGAASVIGQFKAWHQFPGKLGEWIRWGDVTGSKSVALFQEACLEEKEVAIPTGDIGGQIDKSEREEPIPGVCVYLINYLGGVEVSRQLLGCYAT